VTMVFTSSAVYSITVHRSFIDGMWWGFVTATTVGYGDTFPTHLAGRITAVALMVSMVLVVVPAIAAHMASRLIVDADAFTHEEQEEIKTLLREIHEHLGARSS